MVIPRFDRRGDNRIGYISALTALESSDGDSGHGYLEIVDWLDRNSAAASADAKELWRRIVFSIAIGNTDDHLRNHGFLRTNAGWRLAPAFDVNPTPGTQTKYLKTAIGFDDTRADFQTALDVAGYFSVTPAAASGILGETLGGLKNWRAVAYSNRVNERDVATMADALDSATERLAELIS